MDAKGREIHQWFADAVEQQDAIRQRVRAAADAVMESRRYSGRPLTPRRAADAYGVEALSVRRRLDYVRRRTGGT